jgi:hypothetical protein
MSSSWTYPNAHPATTWAGFPYRPPDVDAKKRLLRPQMHPVVAAYRPHPPPDEPPRSPPPYPPPPPHPPRLQSRPRCPRSPPLRRAGCSSSGGASAACAPPCGPAAAAPPPPRPPRTPARHHIHRRHENGDTKNGCHKGSSTCALIARSYSWRSTLLQ